MRVFHCPKCGADRVINPTIGTYNYVCACGQTTTVTVTNAQSACTCPICSKSFTVPLGNFQSSEGTVLDEFDVLNEWTKSGPGNLSLDTTNYRTGDGSLKIDNLSVDNDTYATKEVNVDLSDMKNFMLWVYVYQTQARQTDIVRIAFSTTSNYSKWCEKTWVYLRPGWNCLMCAKDKMSFYGGEDLSSPVVKIRIGAFSGSGSTLIVSFDELRINTVTEPLCVLTFDDVPKQVYNGCFPAMQAAGLKGTLYLTQKYLGFSEYYINRAELDEMFEAGWLVANHSLNHPDFQLISESEIIAEVQGMADWLIAEGFGRGAYHLAYPVGHGGPTVWPSVAQCGILTGREVSGGNWFPQQYYPYSVPANTSLGSGAYLDLAETLAVVDHAKEYGEICFLTCHGARTPPQGDEEWSVADFEALIDHLVEIDMRTIDVDELYRGIDTFS